MRALDSPSAKGDRALRYCYESRDRAVAKTCRGRLYAKTPMNPTYREKVVGVCFDKKELLGGSLMRRTESLGNSLVCCVAVRVAN